jgi:hypothetical protein
VQRGDRHAAASGDLADGELFVDIDRLFHFNHRLTLT